MIIDLALEQCLDFIEVVGLGIRCRQRSHILLNEWTNGLLVEVACNHKGELAGILEALLGHLQDAVVVDVLQVFHIQLSVAGIVGIQVSRQRVGEHGFG